MPCSPLGNFVRPGARNRIDGQPLGSYNLASVEGGAALWQGRDPREAPRMAATGGFWEGRTHAAGDARVVSRKRLHSALGSRQVLRQELEGPQKGSGSEDEK